MPCELLIGDGPGQHRRDQTDDAGNDVRRTSLGVHGRAQLGVASPNLHPPQDATHATKLVAEGIVADISADPATKVDAALPRRVVPFAVWVFSVALVQVIE